MRLSIRNIQTSDIPDVLRLLREFAEYELLGEYCTANEVSFEAALFGKNAMTSGLIARDGETAIGYALFYPNFSSFRGQRGMYLEDIYVTIEYRGTGTGTAMLKEVARLAAQNGYERIDFMVLDWNEPAIRFYRQLGAESNDGETHFKFSAKAFNKLAKVESFD